MTFRASTNISIGGGSIRISSSHVPKLTSTRLFIKFESSEDQLLNELLRKFKNEKFMDIGSNPNNKVDAMSVNNGCIFVVLPEARIMSFIQVIHKYMLVERISALTAKTCLTKSRGRG